MAHLVAALRDPETVLALDGRQWSALLSVARAEVLIGTLAHRVAHLDLPPDIGAVLAAARTAADQAQTQALWEAEMCRRALAPLGIEPILLKGTAYAAAHLPNAAGRQIGDLDILVARESLDEVEAALLEAGWEWVKDDPYDQAYYRQHMHELPPLIHKTRDRMIDVHHTILPLTAPVTPDADGLINESIPLANGIRVLNPEDMIGHASAHLIADGDIAGGLRNLWDIDRLVRSFSTPGGFWDRLDEFTAVHGLTAPTKRALRLARLLYDTPAPLAGRARLTDRLFVAHILARDDWGRETRPLLRLAFYIRSHLLRMPLPMLLRHLWVKWRRG